MARCRVVYEANMELLLMIYWVGLVCCALCLCRFVEAIEKLLFAMQSTIFQ